MCPIDIPSNDMKKVEKRNAPRDTIAKIQTSSHISKENYTLKYNEIEGRLTNKQLIKSR